MVLKKVSELFLCRNVPEKGSKPRGISKGRLLFSLVYLMEAPNFFPINLIHRTSDVTGW